MSYLRPLSLQPLGLKQSALDAWNSHLIQIIRDAQIICRRGVSPSIQSFSNSLKVLRNFDESDDAGDGFNSMELTMNLDAEMLDAYVKSFLPASLQEESFHRGAQMLRKELYFDMFPRYFRLAWRPHFRHLDLPPISDADHRVATLNFIATAFEEEKAEPRVDVSAPVFIETAKFRLFETCEIGIEESYLLKRIVRTSLTNLRVLVLWWMCDDQLLNIIGTSCQFLESLDAWRSTAVTDLGIKMMLSSDDLTGSSKLCHTLKRLVVKETSCTHIGCLVAMIKAVNLEVLSFSHTTTVAKDFFEEIRNMMPSAESSAPPLSYSLKTLFLPVADGTDFEDVIRAFPNLEDLRLWTSAPQLRHLDSSDFPKLHSVLLGGLRSNRILKDLVRVIGHQLTTLKIETVMSDVPIGVVGNSCPNLVELQVVNGRIALDDGHSCSDVSPTFFANLKLVYLFLVQYVVERPVGVGEARISPLQCLLTHAKGIQVLQATGCPGFNDIALKDVVTVNPMPRLRRFILTDASSVLVRNHDQAAATAAAAATIASGGNEGAGSGAATSASSSENSSLALTSVSVMRLFEACPLLQCVGDLRHWNIGSAERRAISKQIQEKTGIRWISTM